MKKKIALSLILGTLISALTLYLALRNVPLMDIGRQFKEIDYFWILPTILLIFLGFGLRVVRWQIILASSHRIGFWQAFHPLMIGFMINCVLPGRVGEVARPVILKRKEGIPFTTALATVAAERVLDIAVLMVLFAAVLGTAHIDPGFSVRFGELELNRELLEKVAAGTFRLSLVLILGMILVSIDASRKAIVNIILWCPKFFLLAGKSLQAKMDTFVIRLVALLEGFASGFALIKNPVKLLICIALSMLIWLFAGLSYQVFAMGFPGLELSFAQWMAILVMVCFFIALPSVPGYWGLWEAGGVFAMALFGVSSDRAAGYTLANHTLQILPVIAVGFISAIITSVNIVAVSYHRSQNTSLDESS
jgi:uncharacterized protein (TIRG00374 family)